MITTQVQDGNNHQGYRISELNNLAIVFMMASLWPIMITRCLRFARIIDPT